MGHRMVALNITVFNVKVKIITLTPNLRKRDRRRNYKSQNFKPALKAFYFATTAVKDAAIEEYIREKMSKILPMVGLQ